MLTMDSINKGGVQVKQGVSFSIWKLLKGADQPMSKREIMQELGFTAPSAEMALSTLKKRGSVKSVTIVNPFYEGRVGDKIKVPGYIATEIRPDMPDGRHASNESRCIAYLRRKGYTVTAPE